MPLENVIIIGAGMGGLLLAHCLQKSNIPFQIFERDASYDSRFQGSCLAIQASAPANFEYALTPELYQQMLKIFPRDPLGQSFDFVDGKTGKLYVRNRKMDGEYYATSRAQLRRILNEGIDVQWGKRFMKYELVDGGSKVVAHFEDGTTAKGDILIGCDGSRSLVRQQLMPGLDPKEVKLTVTAATIDVPPSFRDQVWGTGENQLSRGFLCLGTKGTCMYAHWWNEGPDADHQNETVKVCWRIDYSGSDAYPNGDDSVALLEFAKRKARECMNERFWPLIDRTKPEEMWPGKKIKSMPDFDPWETSRVTLLGDAAHCMTSYGGKGALTAFDDAVDLSKILQQVQEGKKEIVPALAVYEKAMMERGFKAVHSSLTNKKLMHPETALGEAFRFALMKLLGWTTPK